MCKRRNANFASSLPCAPVTLYIWMTTVSPPPPWSAGRHAWILGKARSGCPGWSTGTTLLINVIRAHDPILFIDNQQRRLGPFETEKGYGHLELLNERILGKLTFQRYLAPAEPGCGNIWSRNLP